MLTDSGKVVRAEQLQAGEKIDLTLEIAHLLFIDVVGYSKLLVNEQIELMQQLNRIVRTTECFRDAEASEKMIRLPTGDGMVLLFFRSPEQPVHCALQISNALREWPQIKIRMGIHSGAVNQVSDVNDGVNIAGAGINVGQRVMDCADAGHILLSKHIADDLAQYRHWQPHLHDLGECEVKHGLRLHLVNLYKNGLGNPAIPEKLRRRRWKSKRDASVRPIATTRWPKSLTVVGFVLGAAAFVVGGWILLRHEDARRAAPPEKSIAVLPFENRSEEKANAYFADGVQDEILTRLAKIADLKVISRTSTMHYKSTPENLREIARQLRVTYIVEGSVQRSDDVVRVNVQLINAATDTHIWADTFDRKLTDLFTVETEVARSIADQLQVSLTGQQNQVLGDRPTTDPEAYDAYLRALAFTIRPATTGGNTLSAQKYLRKAVELDPKFAQSWALLSYVDSLSYLALDVQRTDALREEARSAAETALALQPNLGEALHAKGFYHYACLKDYETAVHYFEMARRFLPNSSLIPRGLAYVARRQGQWKQSEAYFNEAERLDPLNVKLLTQHAFLYVQLRKFSAADQKLNQVLELVPGDVDTLALKAAIAQARGDLSGAAALLGPLRPKADDVVALEQKVYQAILERQPSEVIERLKELLAHPDDTLGYVNGELRFWLGWAQKTAGDNDAALASWEQARSELQSFVHDQPQNYLLLLSVAFIDAALGDEATALSLCDDIAKASSIQKDAIAGQLPVEALARVAAMRGHADVAIPALEKLLATPHEGALACGVPLTPALLRLDPMFDALRSNPRFQGLVALSLDD